jgi:ankyrin repeat protein
VQLARRMSKAQPLIAMAKRGDLATRVTAILDRTQSRGRLNTIQIGAALAGALAVVLGIAPLRTVRAAPKPTPLAGQDSRSAQPPMNARRSSGMDRALLEAAADDDVELMVSFFVAGANVNGVVRGDGSPLIAAARAGHLGAARWLLDHGADPNLGVPGDGNPLIMAAQAGRMTVVEFLLDHGADIERVVDGDENALITASAAGQLDVVKFLVARGANVNARVWVEEARVRAPGQLVSGAEWRSPLSMALRRGHDAVVRYLRSVGAQE